jgi:hypothetical protein
VPPEDLVAARLEHFAASTTVLPRPDLHARVLGRLAEEPRTSAPRRFRAALIALDVAAAIRAFRQVVATVVAGRPTGSGPRASVAVRAQALALVLLVVSVVTLAGAAGGVGAVAGIAAIIDGQRVTQPDVPVVAMPTPGPIDGAPAVVEVSTPEPTVEPTPEPTVEPTPPEAEARPATREATPKPTPTDRKPRATTRPSRDDGDTSDRDDDREDRTPTDDGDDREESDDRDERDEVDSADDDD